MRPQAYTKNCRQPKKSRSSQGGSPQGRAHQLVSSDKWSVLKTLIQETLYGLQVTFMKIYMYIHVITTNKKGGHEFGGDGGYMRGFGGRTEKREGYLKSS